MSSRTDGWHETFRPHGQTPAASNRSFGFTFAAIFALLCGWSAWQSEAVDPWLLGPAAAFLIVTIAAPGLLAPLNRVWSAFGRMLHALINPVILALIFFGVITPIGRLARLFGHDPLRRRIDPAAASYWIERVPSETRQSSMKNQF